MKKATKSKPIRISQVVQDYIKALGKFGETPDAVLRRILKIKGAN